MFYRYHPGWRRMRWHMACAAGAADSMGHYADDRADDTHLRGRRRDRNAERASWRHAWGHASWSSGPMFGVRRPLRKLTWRLDLDDQQAQRLADVLNRLKTAYGQADLDRQRANADVAALFDEDQFSASAASAAMEHRLRATADLSEELKRAFARIFEVLDANQRREFARMIRAGEIGF